MNSLDINNFIDVIKKMDQSQLSEGLKAINTFFNEQDKKKIVDMINNIKNQNNN